MLWKEEKWRRYIWRHWIMIKKDGITLISLVITIVVLLILAGVSINAVVGGDGVIKSTQESAKLTEESEAKKINKVVLEYYLARNGETLWYNTPSNKAENCGKGRRSSKIWLNYTCGQKWKNSLVTALNYFK